MNELRNFDANLQTLRERSIDRLLAAEVLDRSAFDELISELATKAEQIADDFVVSKQVLSCLRDGREAVLSRSEYVPQVRKHEELASEFAMLMDLIILGEKPSSRSGAKAPSHD